MLRLHCRQQWFNLSDPAVEEALYDSRILGWAKVRYHGLARNTHWLHISCGLANLYVVRGRLMAGA